MSLLHHCSHCKTGWKSRDTSSPSPADLELLFKAMLPLASSITAAFWRLKLITIRNCLMTRSYKVCGLCYYCDPSVFVQCELSCSLVQPNERYGLDSKWSCCLFIEDRCFFLLIDFKAYLIHVKNAWCRVFNIAHLVTQVWTFNLYLKFALLLIKGPVCQSMYSQNPIDFKGIWPSRMIAMKTNFQWWVS